MSTNPRQSRRLVSGIAATLTTCALAAASARAAEVVFRPTISAGAFHDGNVAVVGGARGDDVASMVVDLVVDRKTTNSLFTFSYRPSYWAYRTSSELDYFGNALLVKYAVDPSRRTHFSVDADASRTDYQGQSSVNPGSPTTFIPRTTETRGEVTVAGTSAVGRRALLDWQLRAGTDRYADIADNPVTTGVVDPIDFNDSTNVGGRFAWRHEISERNSVGLGLDAAHFSYENFSGVFVESLGLVGVYRPSRTLNLEYALGVTRSAADTDTSTDFSFGGTLTQDVTEESHFSAGIRQSIAPGTGLAGPTQDRGAWVSYGRTPLQSGLTGSVLAGYWQRTGLPLGSFATQSDTQTLNANGSIGWSFNRYVALNAVYIFNDQSALNGSDPALETRYSSYGIYLRWAIRGR